MTINADKFLQKSRPGDWSAVLNSNVLHEYIYENIWYDASKGTLSSESLATFFFPQASSPSVLFKKA